MIRFSLFPRRIARCLVAVLIGYAILFSLAGTCLLVYGAIVVYRPIYKARRLERHNPRETAYMSTVRAEFRRKNDADSLIQTFVPLDSISPHLIRAVLAAEDDGFYLHPGIDIAAILSAAEYNRTHKSLRHGGSTITQQVAKNLFLSSERSFQRKVLELGYALLLEKVLGKDRILELYLNYAQWGERIFGCEAAARQYFNKSSSHLGPYESARLAATLAKPTRLNPRLSTSAFITKRLETIANNLRHRSYIDDSIYFGLTGKQSVPDSTMATDDTLDDNAEGSVEKDASEEENPDLNDPTPQPR